MSCVTNRKYASAWHSWNYLVSFKSVAKISTVELSQQWCRPPFANRNRAV